MADYSNFTDIDIKYSSEFKELYYLTLFCIRHNADEYVSDRPFDHTALKHVRDRFLELAIFPLLRQLPHPLAEKYWDHTVEVKPDFTAEQLSTIKSDLASWATINNLSGDDFTTAFEAFKDVCEAGNTYTVDASKATTS